MKKEIEKEKGDLIEAERKYAEQGIFLTALPARISSGEEKVAGLRLDLENARSQRPKTVELIALGKANEQDLQNLGEKIFLLQNQLRNGEDILQQLVKTQVEGREKLKNLSLDLAGRRHSFWNAACQVELEKAIHDFEKNEHPLLRAWLCSNFSGISTTFGIFLQNKIGRTVSEKTSTEELKRKLLRQYLDRETEG